MGRSRLQTSFFFIMHFPACIIWVGQITNDVLDMLKGLVCKIDSQSIENNVNVNCSVVLFHVVYGILLLSLLFSFYNDFCADLLVSTNEN